MKKILVLIMWLSVFLVLSACGALLGPDAMKEPTLNENPEEQANSVEGSDGMEEITIVYSSAAFEHMTTEEVISSFKDLKIHDVIENDDSSYTVTMPKAFHERILDSIRDEVENELEGIFDDRDLKAIKEMKFNHSMTELTVVIDQTLPEDDLEDYVLDEYANYIFNFQMHNGVKLADFKYDIISVDSETGEEFDRRSGLDDWER